MRLTGYPATMAAIAVLLTGCSGAGAESRQVQGDCGDVHGTQVCTWATVLGASVTEVGATIPLAAVEQAPADVEMTWPPRATAVIGLPAEARAATGLDHLTVFWEPHGHPPGPYLYPHFDFHFYNVSDAVRTAIDCTDEGKPTVLPAGYVLPDEEIPGLGTLVGICVPAMGMHSLLESEYHGTEPFTGTMVVGYYAQAPIFVEPMITQSLLARRASFELPVPAIAAPAGVRYPARFRADYDAAIDAYRFVFSGF